MGRERASGDSFVTVSSLGRTAPCFTDVSETQTTEVPCSPPFSSVPTAVMVLTPKQAASPSPTVTPSGMGYSGLDETLPASPGSAVPSPAPPALLVSPSSFVVPQAGNAPPVSGNLLQAGTPSTRQQQSPRSSWAGPGPFRLSATGDAFSGITDIAPGSHWSAPEHDASLCGVMREAAGKVGYGVVPVGCTMVALRVWEDEHLGVACIVSLATWASIMLSEWVYSQTERVKPTSTRLSHLWEDYERDLGATSAGCMSPETARLLKKDIKRSPDRLQMRAAVTANIAEIGKLRAEQVQTKHGFVSMTLTHALPSLVGCLLPLLPFLLSAAVHPRTTNDGSSSGVGHTNLDKYPYIILLVLYSVGVLTFSTLLSRLKTAASASQPGLHIVLFRVIGLYLAAVGVSWGLGALATLL